MTMRQIENRVRKLRALEEQHKELAKQMDVLKEEIKAEMESQDKEVLTVGGYTIRWTAVTSNKFDSANFKKSFNDLYDQFTRQVSSRRFSIS